MRDLEFNEMMQGHLDGELDEAAARRFREAMKGDPARCRRVEIEERLVGKVREALRPRPAPEALRERVRVLVREGRGVGRPRGRGPVVVLLRSRILQTAAAAAAALLLIFTARSLMTSNPAGSILPKVVRDAVDLFDGTLGGTHELIASTRENYPTPPVMDGPFHYAGYSDDGTRFRNVPNPCFLYRSNRGDIAFFCLGSRMFGEDFLKNAGRVFEYKGYHVVPCGVARSFHVWITKLDVKELLRVIRKDYVTGPPIQGITIRVRNLDCCGCADRVMKFVAGLDGVEDVRASVERGEVQVKASDRSPETRRRLVSALREMGFHAE